MNQYLVLVERNVPATTKITPVRVISCHCQLCKQLEVYILKRIQFPWGS